jgi:hypothetical protein
MSRKSVQRFCDNGMLQNWNLKRVACIHSNATRFKTVIPKKWEPVFASLTFGSEKIMVKQEDRAPFRFDRDGSSWPACSRGLSN